MLHVDKVDSFLTEKLKISASGLTPFSNYKFELRLHSANGILRSYCILKSDEHGKIDLPSAKPIRGTYLDADPMGLFMTLERTDDVPFGDMVRNPDAVPFFYTLRLLSESEELLDEVNLKKRYLHPSVTEIEVKQDGIWGFIFKPPGPGPFPCIIDIPVLSGKIFKAHAPLFAAEGFLSFCFPMFDEPGLPSRMQDVDIEYLSKHIKYVESLPYCSDKIGFYGISFAGAIAHHLATKHPEISAIATTNGPEAFYKEKGYMKENGKPMECETLNDSLSTMPNGVLRQRESFLDLFSRLKPETSIKWDQIPRHIPFRILAAMDDWIIDGISNGSHIRDHLLKTGHKVEVEFTNSGHVTVVPYMPHPAFAYNKFVDVILGFGGETAIHSKAQETAWQNHIKFFKKHLGTPKSLPDYERDTHIVIPRKAGSKI
ncbi:unnamed protein product [Caenorhabditis nigoni]